MILELDLSTQLAQEVLEVINRQHGPPTVAPAPARRDTVDVEVAARILALVHPYNKIAAIKALRTIVSANNRAFHSNEYVINGVFGLADAKRLIEKFI